MKDIQKWIVLERTTCEPTIKWAQNESHIFLTIKLSHRWDSPPCLNSLSQKSSIENDTLYYSNECMVGHSKITFETELKFKKEVEENSLDIKRDGVGTYFVQIEKSDRDDIWSFLDQENTNYMIWN